MWTSDIPSIVFTRIKTIVTERLKTKYPDLFFSTAQSLPKEPQFPTVLVKRMQGREEGQTLEGTEINAILSTFQIEVFDNVSERHAQEVADVVCEIMKSMRYEMIGEPFPDNSDDEVFRNIARYRRIVGGNDVL